MRYFAFITRVKEFLEDDYEIKLNDGGREDGWFSDRQYPSSISLDEDEILDQKKIEEILNHTGYEYHNDCPYPRDCIISCKLIENTHAIDDEGDIIRNENDDPNQYIDHDSIFVGVVKRFEEKHYEAE